MSNKQQTAVEWYAEKSIIIFDNLRSGKITFEIWFKEQALFLEQAKEMEKERIKNDYRIGYNNGILNSFLTPIEYYNKTYGGNK